jgi:hypothetical protein
MGGGKKEEKSLGEECVLVIAIYFLSLNTRRSWQEAMTHILAQESEDSA